MAALRNCLLTALYRQSLRKNARRAMLGSGERQAAWHALGCAIRDFAAHRG